MEIIIPTLQSSGELYNIFKEPTRAQLRVVGRLFNHKFEDDGDDIRGLLLASITAWCHFWDGVLTFLDKVSFFLFVLMHWLWYFAHYF